MRGYQNRSEAIRDLARAGLQQAAGGTEPDQPSVAALVYVYDHARRELPKRLTDAFQDHHEMAISTLHVHLDTTTCMEVTVLKGDEGHPSICRAPDRGARHSSRAPLLCCPVESLLI